MSKLQIIELQRQLERRDAYINELDAKQLAQQAALEHCYRVFHSLADRGHYPAELLSAEPEFMGHQGLVFITDALGYRPTLPMKDANDTAQ